MQRQRLHQTIFSADSATLVGHNDSSGSKWVKCKSLSNCTVSLAEHLKRSKLFCFINWKIDPVKPWGQIQALTHKVLLSTTAMGLFNLIVISICTIQHCHPFVVILVSEDYRILNAAR